MAHGGDHMDRIAAQIVSKVSCRYSHAEATRKGEVQLLFSLLSGEEKKAVFRKKGSGQFEPLMGMVLGRVDFSATAGGSAAKEVLLECFNTIEALRVERDSALTELEAVRAKVMELSGPMSEDDPEGDGGGGEEREKESSIPAEESVQHTSSIPEEDD